MAFVYGFMGMVIVCAVIAISLSLIGLVYLKRNVEDKANTVLSWSMAFINCSMYFLVLELIAKIFA